MQMQKLRRVTFPSGKSVILTDAQIEGYGLVLDKVKVTTLRRRQLDTKTKRKNTAMENLVEMINNKFEHTYVDFQPEIDEEMEQELLKIVEQQGKDLV